MTSARIKKKKSFLFLSPREKKFFLLFFLFFFKPKTMRNIVLSLLLSLNLLSQLYLAEERTTLYEWVSVDYDWEFMGTDRQSWLDSGLFIPENCAITGIKQWGSNIYVTVPRWLPGVPGTLNLITNNSRGIPVLRPFPDLNSQNLSNPNAIMYVQSMEIDPSGIMWIIDSGILNQVDPNPNLYVYGTPRLILYDLIGKKFLQSWDLGSVTIQNTSFINDIVVDYKNSIAYISDAGGDGGIILVNTVTNFLRRYSGPSTEAETNQNGIYDICGIDYALGPTPSDGIALTPDGSRVYYSPLIGSSLFSLETETFLDPTSSTSDIEATIVNHGSKLGFSDGLTMTSDGILYYGNLNDCGINFWNISEGNLTTSNQHFLQTSDPESCNWADTFGFDDKGNLLVTTNKLEHFTAYISDFTGYSGRNFRVLSYSINSFSYMNE